MLSAQNFETILIDRRAHGVVLATLNRPEKLNAVNGRMHYELGRLTRDFDDDGSTRVLVITGAGRGFCSGGDFSAGGFSASDGPSAADEGRKIVDHLLECRKPVISAVNGYAMGLGATIALLCDVVIAGRSAVFADTHVRMGLGAGDGGQVVWPLLMGVNRAKYYLMTGERVPAGEAERLGLVNFVVEDADLMAKAIDVAEQLARGPLAAITASKVPINNWIRMQSAQILPLSLALEGLSGMSPEAREAQLAFAEKREPRFSPEGGE